MEDMERYGDYDEIDEDLPRKKSVIGLVLKILVAAVCLVVVAALGFRIILFNTYPDEISDIYFNDKLKAYYNENDGKIGAITQELRIQYDDPDEGNFFCDNLIIIPGINQLQVSVRYNVSLMDSIKEKYGIELDPDSENNFTFELSYIPIYEGSEPIKMGTLSETLNASKMMYRYHKLVFDDVMLKESENEQYWIRLEITINGVEMKEPYKVLIFEDTEEYSKTDEYKLSSREKP